MFSKLKKWRKNVWDWCTATNTRTHIFHFLIVFIGTFLPALFAQILWHNFALSIVVGNLFCEVWLYFFIGREVADYIGHKAKGHDMDNTWLDGLGDLTGPLFIRSAWWAALLTVLFGG